MEEVRREDCPVGENKGPNETQTNLAPSYSPSPSDTSSEISELTVVDVRDKASFGFEEGSVSSTIDHLLTYSNPVWYFCLGFLMFSGGVLMWFSYQDKFESDKRFWINQVLKYLLINVIQYFCSILVRNYSVKVNYTRKIVHISYFIWPQILDHLVLNYSGNVYSEIWNIYLVLLLLFFVSEPFRNRISIIQTLYLSVDRPEDRPYTLVWFSTQIIATLIVFAPFVVYFERRDYGRLVFIPILINGLGDGLAEPVGVRFGKHKYRTSSCLSNRVYTRSYEGSLCVFVVSLITVACYYNHLNLNQYIFCLLTIPITSTFVEAVAPHTWDSPLIYLAVLVLLTFAIDCL